MSNGASTADNSGEGEIRKGMILDDLVEVMISLPTQLFANVQVPATLWFLTKDKTKNGRDRRSETLFLSSKKLGIMESSTRKVFTDKDIALIAETVDKWRKGEDYKDVKGFCKSVTTKDIEDKKFYLTPARYIGIEELEEDDLTFEERFDFLKKEFLNYEHESNEIVDEIISVLKKF